MISHKYKCIFIHIGRTGGTSIELALDKTLHTPEKHWTQRIMRRKYKLYWKDYYKFTCVRNPYDWMVSQYFYNKKINYEWFEKTYTRDCGRPWLCSCAHHRDVDIKTMSFLDFLKFNNIHIREEKLNVFLDELDEIDYIIRFEELQKGFDYVCDQIGKPKTLLERIGSSTHESYMNYYDTQEKIDITTEDYREYFEMFGYEMVNKI